MNARYHYRILLPQSPIFITNITNRRISRMVLISCDYSIRRPHFERDKASPSCSSKVIFPHFYESNFSSSEALSINCGSAGRLFTMILAAKLAGIFLRIELIVLTDAEIILGFGRGEDS